MRCLIFVSDLFDSFHRTTETQTTGCLNVSPAESQRQKFFYPETRSDADATVLISIPLKCLDEISGKHVGGE